MNQFPIIQSLGPPPEKHADRIVAEMLKLIVVAHAKCWPAIRTALKTADGNPAAQERMHRKLKAAVGGFMLGSMLMPGKRGRYCLSFVCLAGWNAEQKTLIDADDPIPEKPWIVLSVIGIESKGGFRYVEKIRNSLFITHHALSRLAQRCGVRTISEVYDAVIRIADRYVAWCVANDYRPPRDGDRLKVELPNGMGNAICALCNHADNETGAVVVTLWREDEFSNDG
jgi:hypothetical protein